MSEQNTNKNEINGIVKSCDGKISRQYPETTAVVPAGPMQSILVAAQNGVDTETISKLIAMHNAVEDREARKAYVLAMSNFKKEEISLIKDGKAGFATKNGGRMTYDFLKLGGAIEVVTPLMSKHGLSHSWTQKQNGSTVTITCKISHAMGHFEQTSLSSGLDTSGQKNPLQQIGSTVSYLQRYTFLSILGLVPKGADDDGQSHMAPPRDPSKYISLEHLEEIESLIDQTGTDARKFLVWMGVERLEDTLSVHVPKAFDALNKKLEKMRSDNADQNQ